MKSNIFIPEKIKVGFQNRNDTYTKKLAYVVYYDTKGVLRKEKSWEGWRDKKIEPLEFENKPMSGFVLNKKAGGYSSGWNHRQTYVRVYDPRDFEFEIDITNLLYILENSNSIKGKGLEGEFVYGWDGKDLVLLPTSSPDYIELSTFNDTLHNPENLKAKDLVLGGTYLKSNNEEVIYLGYFDYYDEWNGSLKGKHHYFWNETGYKDFEIFKSLSNKIIKTVNSIPVPNYADLISKLEDKTFYSPIDEPKTKYIPISLETFKAQFKDGYKEFYSDNGGGINAYRLDKEYYNKGTYKVMLSKSYERVLEKATLDEVFEKFKPMKRIQYLKNGRLKKGDY